MNRREYPIEIVINGRRIIKAVIDPHFEIKHGTSITDDLILKLILQLSDKSFEPEAETAGFQYFVTDNLVLGAKQYRLIWLLETTELYIGVVNAYRTNRLKS